MNLVDEGDDVFCFLEVLDQPAHLVFEASSDAGLCVPSKSAPVSSVAQARKTNSRLP